MKFDDLRLEKPLLDAVRSAGYDTPTPIQCKVIPVVLDGRDVLGCAQTGTGKTAAFALPTLQRLAAGQSRTRRNGRPQPRKVRALVVAPTRELAVQISESFTTYGRSSGLRHTAIFGGVNKRPQERAVRSGVDILVATPGRLLDHMGEGLISLKHIEILILDEADRMLDMGFMPDIKRILAEVPDDRQTLLLSATMPPPIRKLANAILNDPVAVEVTRVSSPAKSVEHWAYRVEKREKPALLCSVLEHTPYSRALVFTRTKHGADKVVRHLSKSGVDAAAIHGNKSQNARTRALAAFRSGKTGVLVATDIAARGLDIDDISHVINYDLTHEPETYIHRIGRTGRAGATGTALSFVSREDGENVRAIEQLLRAQLQTAAAIPGYVPSTPTPERTAQRTQPATQRPRGGSSRNGERTRSTQPSASKNGGRRRSRSRSSSGRKTAAAQPA